MLDGIVPAIFEGFRWGNGEEAVAGADDFAGGDGDGDGGGGDGDDFAGGGDGDGGRDGDGFAGGDGDGDAVVEMPCPPFSIAPPLLELPSTTAILPDSLSPVATLPDSPIPAIIVPPFLSMSSESRPGNGPVSSQKWGAGRA
ncbi:hypothetical protein Drorol1_Dr00000964 [Drosera rotundifolia]